MWWHLSYPDWDKQLSFERNLDRPGKAKRAAGGPIPDLGKLLELGQLLLMTGFAKTFHQSLFGREFSTK
jgi:hypothetical protein